MTERSPRSRARPSAPQPQEPPGASRFASIGKGTAPALAAAGALVALSTAVSALVFSFWPGLKPSPPPQKLSASFTKIQVEPEVPFRVYMSRLGQSRDKQQAVEEAIRRAHKGPGAPHVTKRQIREAIMRTRGLEIYVQVQVEGFRVRQFRPVRVSLHNAATGSQVYFPHPRGNVFIPLSAALARVLRLGESSHVRPTAPDDLRGALLWTPNPFRSGRLFVRVELYDVNGDLIDFKDSPTFRCVDTQATYIEVRCLVPR